MDTTIKIRVYGGVVQGVEFWGKAGVQVLVYDYDVEGTDLTPDDIDEDGDLCTVAVYQP
jgi:hypothetical protein